MTQLYFSLAMGIITCSSLLSVIFLGIIVNQTKKATDE